VRPGVQINLADSFLVRLTVIDTPGFGDYVNNRDSWMPIIEFLDDQHESYMLQEQQPRRVDKIDLRVHACLYFIRPTGHTLKPLDIEVMKRLSSRVNLIPVVAKADTLSPADLARFKQRVGEISERCGRTILMFSRSELLSKHKALRFIPHQSRRTMKPLRHMRAC
jgi:septin family protein